MGRDLLANRTIAGVSNQNDQPTRLVGYIRDMLQELGKLSPAEAGPMLPYLIEMARQEAQEAEDKLANILC